MNRSEQDLARLLDSAQAADRVGQRPPALLTCTARMARYAPRYGRAAYAVALRQVGMVQQTFRLAAAEMGVQCDAVDLEDGEAASAALRLDWPAQVSVGDLGIAVGT